MPVGELQEDTTSNKNWILEDEESLIEVQKNLNHELNKCIEILLKNKKQLKEFNDQLTKLASSLKEFNKPQ